VLYRNATTTSETKTPRTPVWLSRQLFFQLSMSHKCYTLSPSYSYIHIYIYIYMIIWELSLTKGVMWNYILIHRGLSQAQFNSDDFFFVFKEERFPQCGNSRKYYCSYILDMIKKSVHNGACMHARKKKIQFCSDKKYCLFYL